MIIYRCFSNAFSIFFHRVLLAKLERDGLDGWTHSEWKTGVTTWLKEGQLKAQVLIKIGLPDKLSWISVVYENKILT